jgi:FixJ family two-component response regulator
MLNSVMVVDDESSIRSAVEQWLSLSGFEVQLFSRADECLARLPKHYAGVILSDVRMPGMTGLELLAEVQRRDADLPVILLTGHGDVPMAVDAMRDGAYDFSKNPSARKPCSAACAAHWTSVGWSWKTAPCMNRRTTAPNSMPRCWACPAACRPCAGKCWTWRRCRSTC